MYVITNYYYVDLTMPVPTDQSSSNAKYCLLLPGSSLDLSALLACKKFRSHGNKEGALTAMRVLEENGLGRLVKKGSHRGASAVS